MPPPTCRVRRRPSATNVRMRMLVCIAPSGPIQPSAPVYGPRRTGSRPSRSSIARIFGAPVIDPPGNDAPSRSNASRPSASRPVTVDTRCWTAAVRSSRHRRGTRTVPGTQTRPRSLRRTSTIITFSARSLALASSSQASARSSARSRPRGRVPLIGSLATRPVLVDRQERLGRGAQQGARRDRSRATARGRGTPRTATGRRCAGVDSATTGRPRTASPADGSGWPGRCRRGRCGARTRSTPASYSARARALERNGRPARRRRADSRSSSGAARRASNRACTSSRRRASRRASPSSARPPSQACPVRRSQATTQSCRARRSGGRPWSSGAIVGSRSRTWPEVVAEEPDEAAEEARRVGRDDRRRRRGERPGGGRRRTGPGRRPAPRGRRPGRRSGTSSGRCGPGGHSRGWPGPGRSRKASAASMARPAAMRSGRRRRRTVADMPVASRRGRGRWGSSRR